MKRLAVIDGKSVFYRGYYAMRNLSTSEGIPTGGVFGFASMAIELIKKLEPDYVAVESNGYYEHRTFKDRPGVGWMLYLPRELTVQQVPEARALVPVMEQADKGRERQVGTIVVSVTDAPFSDQDPEHVRIANAIETRLADQDLLPR